MKEYLPGLVLAYAKYTNGSDVVLNLLKLKNNITGVWYQLSVYNLIN